MKNFITLLVCLCVAIGAHAQLSVSVSNDTLVCSGDSAQLNAVASGGTPAYTYAWSPSTGLSCTSCQSPKASPAAKFTYTVTITDGASNTATDTVVVAINPLVPIAFAVRDTICPGDTTTLSVITCDFLYDNFDPLDNSQWTATTGATVNVNCGSNGGNALWFGATGTREAITKSMNVAAGGTIDFWIHISNGFGATCEDADQLNESVNLEYSTDGGSSWTLIRLYDRNGFGSWTNIIEVIPVGAQTTTTLFKWVQPVNSGSCCDHWSIDDVDIICDPTSGGITFAWTPNGSLSNDTIDNPIASPTVTTTYTVVVTDSLCTATTTYTVNTINLGLTVGGNTDICIGDNATLSVSSNITGTTYAWTPFATLSCSTCKNPIATPATTTTYTVIGINSTCSDTDTVSITVHPLPTPNAGTDVAICNGDSTQLNGTGGGTYVWTPATGLDNPNIANPSAKPSITTTYTVTVTSQYGCVDLDSVFIDVRGFAQVTAEANRDTICSGDTTQLMVVACSSMMDDFDPVLDPSNWSSIVGGYESTNCGSNSGLALYFDGNNMREANTNNMNVLSGGSIDFWIHIGNGAAPCENADLLLESVDLEYSTDNGSTWTQITRYDRNGFGTWTQITETIPVTAQTSSTMFRWKQPQSNGSCCDHWAIDDVQISCSGIGQGNYTYTWFPSTNLSDATVSDPIATLTSTQTYTVTVDDSGCSKSDTITIVVNPQAVASFTHTISGNVVTFTNTSTDATNYEWDFGDGQKSANTNTTHYFLYGGIYAVQLISTNQYGCNDTVIIDVDMTHLGIDEFAHGNLNSLGVYPNPYQDKTEIVYELRENADVSIIVYNILGEEVARLYEGTQPAGQHQIQFSNEKERSATAVVVRNENTSGIYILKMTINESEVYTRRIIKSR